MKVVLLALVAVVALGVGVTVVVLNATGTSVKGLVREVINDAGSIVLSQFVRLADRYLVPDLACESTEFDAPGTVTLRGLTLKVPQDATSRGGSDILRLDELVLTLTEMPSLSKPLAIERVTITGGSLDLVQTEDGLAGLSPFVKPNAGQTSEQESDADGESAEGEAPEYSLSDLLTIRTVEISGFSVAYYPQDGGEPTRLTDLGTTLNLQPGAEGTQQGSGGYAIEASITRAPAMDLTITATLNDAISRLNDIEVNAELTLNEGERDALPPSLTRILEEYRVNGQATLTASADAIRFDDPAATRATANLRVRDARAQVGDRRILASRVDADATVRGTTIETATIDANAYQGTISMRGTTPQGSTISDWTWSMSDLNLMDVLTQPGEGPPRLAGTLSGEGTLTLDPADTAGTLGGQGTVNVRDGRFVAIPVLKQLATVLEVASPFESASALNQRMDAEFTLHPERVHITDSEVVTTVFAARATGDIHFDSTLDLNANAGPLEKIQNMLGIVGDIFGKITDRLVTYRIKGTISDPKITVAPLGVGG